MILRVQPLQFDFVAMDPIRFREGTAGNTFRGALGVLLRGSDLYPQLFAPTRSEGPSGMVDRPRPFVLRPSQIDGRLFLEGMPFTLTVNLFDPTLPALESLRAVFSELAVTGLGPGRPRVALTSAVQLPEASVSLQPRKEAQERIAIEFLTPTELRSAGQTLAEPNFDAVFKRARDRIAALLTFYQGHTTLKEVIDFRAIGERAETIRLASGVWERHQTQRRSTRTGETHPIGGFTGRAIYEGDLTEFLPWLEAAEWTGVGRHTVWGNGQIRVSAAHPESHAGIQ